MNNQPSKATAKSWTILFNLGITVYALAWPGLSDALRIGLTGIAIGNGALRFKTSGPLKLAGAIGNMLVKLKRKG